MITAVVVISVLTIAGIIVEIWDTARRASRTSESARLDAVLAGQRAARGNRES